MAKRKTPLDIKEVIFAEDQLEMTDYEIVRRYCNRATRKWDAIQILAELNDTPELVIRAVLVRAGVPGIKMPRKFYRGGRLLDKQDFQECVRYTR